MSEQPVAYPGYATPTFTHYRENTWAVTADPWGEPVGLIQDHGPLAAGWTAATLSNLYVGLFPDKQAAGEALVKHAGYEVLG